MHTEKIGLAAGALGAGRKTKEDPIDYGAGILLHKKTGSFIEKGDPIATFYASDPALFEAAESLFSSAIVISEEKPEIHPIIEDIIE